ncbi:MAG TPA: hypothetical protein PLH56_00550 [Candidatus Omnitrophota bacterium]|nr:hypothetical protein [Candidatus Omnitrophota bacterium]
MKKSLLAVFLLVFVLLSSGCVSAQQHNRSCCVKKACACSKEECCKDGTCNCQGQCCTKDDCRCGQGQCGKECECKK